MCITYEHLMSHSRETLASIADFLGIADSWTYSQLHKLMVRPYRDVVTNYDDLLELEQALTQSILSGCRGGAEAAIDQASIL
jgi:hypothetical protein